MFQASSAYQSLYRPKIDLIINWTHLMERSDLNDGIPVLSMNFRYGESQWKEISELNLRNRKSPFCEATIQVEHLQGTTHEIMFQLKSVKTKKQYLLETKMFSLEGIFTNNNQAFITYPDSKGHKPDIVITARWREHDLYEYLIDIKCENIKDVEYFSKTDPYIRIMRLSALYTRIPNDISKVPPTDWQLMYYSEFKLDDLNPDFNAFILPSKLVCNENSDWPLRMELWDYDDKITDPHKFIGAWHFTIKDLILGMKSGFFNDQNNKQVGKIIIEKFEAKRNYNILDCFQQGLEINTYAIIDYSSSNTDPQTKQPIHHFIQNKVNPYMQAILAIMPSFFQYDHDGKIPLYGMGATFPKLNEDETKQFFRILGRGSGQKVPESAEMMNLFYMNSFTYLQGSEPTRLEPAIRGLTEWTKDQAKLKPHVYTVAVVFTDGLINDVQDTVKALAEASHFGLSVVIVCVTDHKDITDMVKSVLDNDEFLVPTLKGVGQTMLRDIVQVVSLPSVMANPAEFTYEVMSELPKQMVEYFQRNNLFFRK